MLGKLHTKIRNHRYGYFIYKSILLFAIVFVLDFGIGNLFRYFYFNQISGEQYRTTYAIEKTTADIIIFGSSRANHHYHPEVFEHRLGMPFQNIGIDGNFLFYHYAVLKSVLARHTPKLIILDVVAQEFAVEQYNYDRLSALLPYYKNHPEMREIIEMKSSTEKMKLISQIYPFNSSLLSIAIGNTEFNKKRKPDINGYIPMSKVLSGDMPENNIPTVYEIDRTKLTIYQSFIDDCKASGVELIIVCSPYYYKFKEPIYSITLAREIAEKNQVAFFDFSTDSLFTHSPHLFADHSHLNDEGAKLFSENLIHKIQRSSSY